MMKKLISLFTVFSIVGSMLGAFVAFADEPAAVILKISTLAELEAFRNSVNAGDMYEGKTVVLTADIDMSGTYGEGKTSWTEIKNFAGTFDGGGHTLNGLYINTEEQYANLFREVIGTIKNLHVKGLVSTTHEKGLAAGIAGIADSNSAIIACTFDGTVTSKFSAAGIVEQAHGLISGCRTDGTITGEQTAGGIASTLDGGSAINCVNNSEVVGYSPVGGIAGLLQSGTITSCANIGRTRGYNSFPAFDVPQGFNVGGIAGEATGNAGIETCYNTADISGGSGIGGILGEIECGDDAVFVSIKNCYNTAMVGGQKTVAGILGDIYDGTKQTRPVGTIQNCYNIGGVSGSFSGDGITNAFADGYGETMNTYYLEGCISSGAQESSTSTALTRAQLADKSNLANWDFETVWKIDELLKRPVLRFNREAYETIEIATLTELERFRTQVNNGNEYTDKIIKLTADIDMSEKYGEGKECWRQIGFEEYPFAGIFDGGGHTISGLYINSSEEFALLALFGLITGTIKNLNVKGMVSATSDISDAAGIAAIVEETGAIIDCSFNGTVECPARAGGLATINYGSISGCTFRGRVEGIYQVGGIVGVSDGTITHCVNEGDIAGTVTVGGIAGGARKVTNCVNKGSVTGKPCTDEDGRTTSFGVGGIVGMPIGISSDESSSSGLGGNVLAGTSVENCYNTGAVTGDTCVGGIVGAIAAGGEQMIGLAAIENCYNLGAVTSTGETDGEHEIGGVVGTVLDTEAETVVGEAVNCYYLVGTADKGIAAVGEGGTDTITALTAAQFASGEAAYLLNGGVSEGDLSWFQTIGKDASPVRDNTHLVVWYDGERYYNQVAPYGYEITNLYLTDNDGNTIPKPTKSTGFRIHMDVTGEGESRDVYFIAAAYGTNSALIGASCIKDDIPTDKSFSLDMAMQKTEKEISQLKVFAWNFPGNMVAASEVKTLSFPEE